MLDNEPSMRIGPGNPYPLGAAWDGAGVNFALFSENATGVELCVFDADDKETRIAVREHTDQVWHVYLPEARPGQRYGYRVTVLDARSSVEEVTAARVRMGRPYALADRSLVVLRLDEGRRGRSRPWT